jgi:hypothetical protein
MVMDKQVLILRAQANNAARKAGRVQKLAERWIDDVWRQEELRIDGCVPCDPVAARRHAEYMNTRPVDRYDASPHDAGYVRIGGRVWAEIERLLVARIFWAAAFEDGPGSFKQRRGNLKRLQEIADAAIADGTADALDEDGQVPDVPDLNDVSGVDDV